MAGVLAETRGQSYVGWARRQRWDASAGRVPSPPTPPTHERPLPVAVDHQGGLPALRKVRGAVGVGRDRLREGCPDVDAGQGSGAHERAVDGDGGSRDAGRVGRRGLECPGVAPPWRAGQIKERLRRLKIHRRRHTPFYEGIGAILSNVSATTCIYCGRPGRMRTPGWMHPACDQCWALEQRNPELVNPNREAIEDLVRAPAPRPVVGSSARDASTRLRASPRFLPAPPHALCGPDCTAGAGSRARRCAAA